MVRGKMILITDKSDYIFSDLGCLVSCEFNGDMCLSHYGKQVIKALEKIDNVKDFHDYLKEFNDTNFQYDIDYFRTDYKHIENKVIDITNDYFSNWFSDYLYFKNASNEEVSIQCFGKKDKEGNDTITETTIKSGEIKVFYFGKEYDYKSELRELEEEELFEELERLGIEKVDKLYRLGCLKSSGVETDKKTMLKLENTLRELWLKDENNACISWLSDKLVYLFKHRGLDLDNYATREVLVDIYNLID